MKSKKKTGKVTFFVVLVLILALTYTAFFGIENYYGDNRIVYLKGSNDIRWGIDISGGVEAVFAPDKKNVDITDDDMDAAKTILETRLVQQNITDFEVYPDYAKHNITVRFPWESGESDFEPDAAVAKLGETAQLYFYNGSDNSTTPFMNGDVVDKATATPDPDTQYTGTYVVALEFNEKGKAAFAKATQTAASTGGQISIYLDTVQISVADCDEAITEGSAIIRGSMTAEAAAELADKINAGSLPFALTCDDEKLQVVSPTLGSNALNVMLIAGVVAFALICILMILRYRLPGVIASFALLGQLAGMIACISGYFSGTDSFTLTIPGIAGIILSIGVGVDCNVISFERIREEFKNGKTIDGAIESGYQNSLSAVIDGNITIVIVSVVLMGAFGTPDSLLAKIFSPVMSLFGSTITGSIYSFGYTLLVGTIFNLIMGIWASKKMMKSISRYKCVRNPWLYGGVKDEK